MKKSKKLNKNIILLFSFTLPITILLILFFYAHIFPFGNNTIIVNDAANQYVSILAYFKNNVLHAPQKLLYSFNLGLGNQFFSVLMYYLFSPVNLISLLFPTSKLPIFFVLNTLFNAGLMGYTSCFYLTKSNFINRNIDEDSKVEFLRIFFSSCFSLSIYFMIYNHCEMWFNTIAFFPLLLLAFEKLLFEKKPIFFAILYPILFISNYYITFIISFFLFILTIYWFFLNKEKFIIKFKNLCLLGGITISGVLVGSISLIPSLLSQKLVEDQEKIQIGFGRLFNPIDFIKSILFNPGLPNLIQKGQITYSYVPYIYSSIFILILVIYFFISKEVSKKEKIIGISLLLILLLCSWNVTLYEIWHGFTWPHGYPQRESFIIIFVLIILAYRGLMLNIDILVTNKKTLYSIGFLLLVLDAIFNLRNCYKIGLGMIIIFGFIIILINLNSKFNISYIFFIFLFTMDIFFTNYKLIYTTSEQSVRIGSFDKAFKEKSKKISILNNTDKSFFRIGTSTEINSNDPLLFNYNGLSNYVSQQQSSVIKFMGSMGYLVPKNKFYRWIEYNNGSTQSMDSLLGVKYYINDGVDSNNIINTRNTMRNLNYDSGNAIRLNNARKNDLEIYKNKNYFPIVFSAPKKVTDKINLKYSSLENPFENQNKVWEKFGGKLYSKVNVEKESDSANLIVYDIKINKSGCLYWYLPYKRSKEFSLLNYKQAPSYEIKVNNKKISNMFSNYIGDSQGQGLNSEDGVVCLGKVKKGQRINLQIKKISEGNLKHSYQSLPYLYIENESLLKNLKFKYIDSNKIKNIKVSNTSITFTTNNTFSQDGVMLTIPYDDGWNITVNNKRVIPKKALGTFIYVKLNKNKVNNVKISYQIPGLKISLVLSIIGILLIVLFVLKKYLY